VIGTIYALTSPEGEIRYCGKTITVPSHRMHTHKRDAFAYRHRHVCNWLRTIYEAGQQPKMMVCETIDLTEMSVADQRAAMNEAERRWIAQLKALGFRLTNATHGGDGRHGHQNSAEHRAKISAGLTGKKFSAERRAKMSETTRKQVFKRGPENPRFGKPQLWKDPEARVAKILATKASWPEEKKSSACAHLVGNTHAKRKLTEDQVNEIRSATGRHSDIAKTYGVSQAHVSNIKSGKSRKNKEK